MKEFSFITEKHSGTLKNSVSKAIVADDHSIDRATGIVKEIGYCGSTNNRVGDRKAFMEKFDSVTWNIEVLMSGDRIP